jgi:hypothetical protein
MTTIITEGKASRNNEEARNADKISGMDVEFLG